MKRGLLFFTLLVPLLASAAPGDTSAVVGAINALGLDLYHAQSAGDGNLLFSPYSIQNALAMAYAGAAGDTRAEMQGVLRYPADDTALHAGFAELAEELAQIQTKSAGESIDGSQDGLPLPGEFLAKRQNDERRPVELHVANRLFVQRGYELRAPFLALIKEYYGATPEELDFIHAAENARTTINQWAEDNTNGKIRDLISPGTDLSRTGLALIDAVYLRALWDKPFNASATKTEPFFVHGIERVSVPTMQQQAYFGYANHHGFTVLTLPYQGGDLQFLILLPDKRNGLPALERKITLELLAGCAKLPSSDVVLYMPKFKLEPPSIALSEYFRHLGMKTAFDEPKGSANFDRMAPRKPDNYLCIGEVFHKAFFSLDEKSTEAAAATGVADTVVLGIHPPKPPKPVVIHADHPFIFAIQHVPSGECLFLGRVTDPR